VTIAAADSFFDSSTWAVARNLSLFLVVVFWLASDERRERELEMRAIEARLAENDLSCPVCRGRVDSSYLVCPVCTTRLKQACAECGAPLEPIWQACPYCATPVPPAAISGGDALQPLRPRRRSR